MYWHINTNKGNIVEPCGRTTGRCHFIEHYPSEEEARIASAAMRRKNDWKTLMAQYKRAERESEKRMVVPTNRYNPFLDDGMVGAWRKLDALEAGGFSPQWQSYRIPIIYPGWEKDDKTLYLERTPYTDTADGTVENKYRIVAYDKLHEEEMTVDVDPFDFEETLKLQMNSSGLSRRHDAPPEEQEAARRAAANAIIDARLQAEDQVCTDFSGYCAPSDSVERELYENRLPSNHYYIGDNPSHYPYNHGEAAMSFFRHPDPFRVGDFNLANTLARPSVLRRFMLTDDQASNVGFGTRPRIGFSWTNDEAGTSKASWTLKYAPPFRQGSQTPWSMITREADGTVKETPITDPEDAAMRLAMFNRDHMPHGAGINTEDHVRQWVKSTIREVDEIAEEARVLRERNTARHNASLEEEYGLGGSGGEAGSKRGKGFLGRVRSLMG